MDDEVWNTLLRFHREVFLPDFQRIFGDIFTPFRNEMRLNFDEMHRRFDRLESQAHDLSAAFKRIEEKLDRWA